MKIMIKTFFMLLLAGLTTMVNAQWATLVVFSPKGEKFTLYFNGEKQNTEPATRIQVDEIKGPTCKVRLVFEAPGVPDLSKTIFNKVSSTMYYAIVRNSRNAFILQSSSSEWSDEPEGKGKQQSTPPPPPGKTEKQEVEKVSTGKKGCSKPMAEADFIASLVSVSSPPFDPPKLSAAKKLAAEHCLTTTQVREVIHVFDNESTRLSFAKFAYDHTWDIENYFDVSDALHSEKSRDDLERFINSKK